MTRLSIYRLWGKQALGILSVLAMLALLALAPSARASSVASDGDAAVAFDRVDLPPSLRFKVWLDDRSIGEHEFRFAGNEQLTVESAVSLEVKILFRESL